MPYQQARQIETRLEELVRLMRAGHHSTPTLARALGVSRPTVARCLSALRGRGYAIHSVRDEAGWGYQIISEPTEASTPGREAR